MWVQLQSQNNYCRWFTVAAAMPPLVFLVFQRLLPESPYYLYNRGRDKEAKRVLDSMAKVNKVGQSQIQNIFDKVL